MQKRPSLVLPGGLDVSHTAELCRVAVRSFLDMPPEKRALSEWLLGPYQEATAFCARRHGHSTPPRPDSMPPPAPLEGVAELVACAKRAVRAAVDAAIGPNGSEALIRLLPPVVHLAAVHDVYGGHGFVPMDVARTKLTDRVLSLLVADYLTRPDEFIGQLPTWFAREKRHASGVSSRAVDMEAVTVPGFPKVSAK